MTHDLIQNIYSVFSKYQLNDKVTACYCDICMTVEYSDYLHKMPLNELTADALNVYIACVGIDEGNCNDFKYFLPRILELLYKETDTADFSDFYIFIWGVLERIDYSTWEGDEQMVFINFFEIYWNKVRKPEDPELSELTLENIKRIVLKPFAL